MKITLLAAFALLGLIVLPPAATAATIIFSDNFDDGDVSDWTLSSNFSGTTAVTVRNDISVSPDYALYTWFDAPPGGSSLFVHATHSFNVATAGDYSLDLWAKSAPCQGCTISYDVIVDGSSLTRTFAPSAFEQRSFALTGLTAGSHDLTLGIFTTGASSGRFNASFDDVVVSGNVAETPEPASVLLAVGALVTLGLRRRA